MEAVQLLSEGETGHAGEYEQLNWQQPVLYPPSYFKPAVSIAEVSAEPDEHERTASAAAASPASTFVVCKDSSDQQPQKTLLSGEKELTALRTQNETLRSQLQALYHAPSASALPPLHPYCTPGILTSDLLQVECDLQSRLSRSEGEVRRLGSQLAVLQNTIRDQRNTHSQDKDTLICQHRAAMDQVMGEKREVEERRRREVSEWRERLETADEREKESKEELNRAEEKLAHLTLENSGLLAELEEEKKAHSDEVASLHMQLSSAEDQIGSTQSELQAVRSRVEQLESYLGGELPEEGSGVTWREERTALLERLTVSEEDRERMEKETQLMAIRLAAISEILSLQETRLMQGKEADVLVEKAEVCVMGERGSGDVREGSGGVKGVLSLWREKVFVLLVQSRLQQMQHTAECNEVQHKVCALEVEVGQVSQERELLSHTLTDRTAQLQLQITQNEELESRLREVEQVGAAGRAAVDSLRSRLSVALSSVYETRQRWSRFKSCVDGCLSRLANYEQRVGVATGRVAALRAMLTSQLVLQGGGGGGGGDAEPLLSCEDTTTQTELPETPHQLSQLSHDELMEEVVSLLRERDALTDQLSQSTASLQQLRLTTSAQQQTLNETCSTLQANSRSLRQQLTAATAELEEFRQREAQLKSTQASLQARIDSAVMEERRKGRRELNEAQSLLEVARREQSKTALQLQLTERKLQSGWSSAVEAVKVSKQGVEEELQRCRERLRAVQVERNLLLTTLRQEGIKIPPRRPQPKPMPAHLVPPLPHQSPPTIPHTQLTTSLADTRQPQTNAPCPVGSETSESPSPSPPPPTPLVTTTGGVEGRVSVDRHSRAVDEETCDSQCTEADNDLIITGTFSSPPPHSHNKHTSTENNEEDICDVLKELQLLSTSLLDMRTVT